MIRHAETNLKPTLLTAPNVTQLVELRAAFHANPTHFSKWREYESAVYHAADALVELAVQHFQQGGADVLWQPPAPAQEAAEKSASPSIPPAASKSPPSA